MGENHHSFVVGVSGVIVWIHNDLYAIVSEVAGRHYLVHFFRCAVITLDTKIFVNVIIINQSYRSDLPCDDLSHLS